MACSHFAEDYSEARKKFLAACAEAGLSCTTYVNPRLGPAGEPLCTDVVSFGPDPAERILIVNSAIHGVEGFCGSAAITAWLRSGDCMQTRESVRVVLVHALNPYGFAWLRRVNEDNVDLNRNFFANDVAIPRNHDYDALHPKFIPKNWNKSAAADIKEALTQYAAEHGLLTMQARICSGQYKYQNGLFYGGRRATWSHQVFKSILRDNAAAAERIVLLDFHTGLGAYGIPELICSSPPDQSLKSWFSARLTSARLGNASGPALSGTIGQGLRQTVQTTDVYSITVEFGTYDVYRVLMAIIADNWLHFRGRPQSGLGLQIKREIRNSFYPDQDDWRKLVMEGSQLILNEAAAGLAGRR